MVNTWWLLENWGLHFFEKLNWSRFRVQLAEQTACYHQNACLPEHAYKAAQFWPKQSFKLSSFFHKEQHFRTYAESGHKVGDDGTTTRRRERFQDVHRIEISSSGLAHSDLSMARPIH